MSYEIALTSEARDHLGDWKKSGQKKSLEKIFRLIEELRIHPRSGTGKPEQLKGSLSGFWSRKIDKANRIIYMIEDDRVIVTIISLRTHYGDK